MTYIYISRESTMSKRGGIYIRRGVPKGRIVSIGGVSTLAYGVYCPKGGVSRQTMGYPPLGGGLFDPPFRGSLKTDYIYFDQNPERPVSRLALKVMPSIPLGTPPYYSGYPPP